MLEAQEGCSGVLGVLGISCALWVLDNIMCVGCVLSVSVLSGSVFLVGFVILVGYCRLQAFENVLQREVQGCMV